MFLSSDDAKAIADKILARSNADACVVRIDGGEDLSLRFARAGATTNIATSEISLRVSSHIGARIGSVSTTRLDDDALEAARARSEEIARMLPVDPDYVAPLGPQTYETAARYDDNAASLRLDALASEAAQVIAEGARVGVDTFGCASSARRFETLATSNGLFAYERRSEIDLSATALTTASGGVCVHSISAKSARRRTPDSTSSNQPAPGKASWAPLDSPSAATNRSSPPHRNAPTVSGSHHGD